MLTFLAYSALLGFTLLFPLAFCVEYFKEPPGRREVTYGSAFLMLVLSVVPIVNLFITYYYVGTAFEVLSKTLANRALITDKGKK